MVSASSDELTGEGGNPVRVPPVGGAVIKESSLLDTSPVPPAREYGTKVALQSTKDSLVTENYLGQLTFIERFFDNQERRIVNNLDRAERRVIAARRGALAVTTQTPVEELYARVPHAIGPKRAALSERDGDKDNF